MIKKTQELRTPSVNSAYSKKATFPLSDRLETAKKSVPSNEAQENEEKLYWWQKGQYA